jgi:hypothetical protein
VAVGAPGLGTEQTGGMTHASNGDGEVFDEPSDEVLLQQLDALEQGGEFLIVERDETHFAQTAYGGDPPWVLEVRDGSAAEHYQVFTDDKAAVHGILTSYVRDAHAWRGLAPWTKVDVGG